MPGVPELPAPDDTDLSDYVKRIESRARERAPTTVKGTYIGTLLGAAAFGPIGGVAGAVAGSGIGASEAARGGGSCRVSVVVGGLQQRVQFHEREEAEHDAGRDHDEVGVSPVHTQSIDVRCQMGCRRLGPWRHPTASAGSPDSRNGHPPGAERTTG